MEKQRFSSNASTGFIIWEEALRRRSPARELEPKVAYRLRVGLGEQSGEETLLGGRKSSGV
jgi:hypothetical protein